MNRLRRGEAGKVPYERIKGTKPTVLGIEFGEKVMYKLRIRSKLEKISKRLDFGTFVGVRWRSKEIMVSTPDGIRYCRSVKRLPVERRWSEDSLKWVQWCPWRRYKDAPDGEGDVPEGVPEEERKLEGSKERMVFIETQARAPQDFSVTYTEAKKHGFTRGCAGCSSWGRGITKQPHTQACRDRFRILLQDNARFQLNQQKRKEYEQRMEDQRGQNAGSNRAGG